MGHIVRIDAKSKLSNLCSPTFLRRISSSFERSTHTVKQLDIQGKLIQVNKSSRQNLQAHRNCLLFYVLLYLLYLSSILGNLVQELGEDVWNGSNSDDSQVQHLVTQVDKFEVKHVWKLLLCGHKQTGIHAAVHSGLR